MSFKPVYNALLNNVPKDCWLSFIYGLTIGCNNTEILEDNIALFEQYFEKKIYFNKFEISSNPNAIPILEINIGRICWQTLSKNPNAIHIIEHRLNTNFNNAVNEVNWYYLSRNPNALPLLERYFKYIVWTGIAYNPNPKAMVLLEKHLDKLSDAVWWALSTNPNAFHILEKHLDKIHWDMLCENPHPGVVHLLKHNLDKVNWGQLSKNTNPDAIDFLEYHLNNNTMTIYHVDWWNLSGNPSAISMLERHIEHVDWYQLSKNPNAISLIENYVSEFEYVPYEIEWKCIAVNPSAINLLRNHLDKFDTTHMWFSLGSNPNVAQILGVIDYEKMRANCQPFAKELAEYVFHPSRLIRVCFTYGLDLADYMEIIGD